MSLRVRNIIFIIIFASIIIGIWFAFFNQQQKPIISQKNIIATTIFPLSDITQNIAQNNAEVVNILPAGASPHTFEPTPDLIIKLQQAKVIFKIGHGADDWVDQISKQIPNIKIVTVDKNIKLLEFNNQKYPNKKNSIDPHYWLTADNAKIISQNIAQELSDIDPRNKESYQNNLLNYQKQLSQLNQKIKNKLSKLSNPKILVHHPSWNYFARDYGLDVVGSFEINPGQEPTPKQLAELQNKVKQNNLQAIFIEPQLSIDSIKQFTKDMKIKIITLDPIGGANIPDRNTYLELLWYNTQQIANSI